MRTEAVLGFLLAVAPLVATPGASLTLLVQRVASDGRRAWLPIAAGTVTGLFVHASLAALGLSALVMRSSEGFALVRWTGAAYLAVLGLLSLRAKDATTTATTPLPQPPTVRTPRPGYLQALLGNVLNPKAASIYLTVAPQFVTPRHPVAPQILELAAAQSVLVALWLLLWATVLHGFTARVGAWYRRLTGAVLLALALRTAHP